MDERGTKMTKKTGESRMKRVEGYERIEIKGKTIEVLMNNLIVREKCPVCGESHNDADIPYWFFIAGSELSVCRECMKTVAPDVLGKIEAANAKFQDEMIRREN